MQPAGHRQNISILKNNPITAETTALSAAELAIQGTGNRSLSPTDGPQPVTVDGVPSTYEIKPAKQDGCVTIVVKPIGSKKPNFGTLSCG